MLQINHEDIKFNTNTYNSKIRAAHKKKILQVTGWNKFSNIILTELTKYLLHYVKQQMHPKQLFSVAAMYLINRKIELPPYYILADVISKLYSDVEHRLVKIVETTLTDGQKSVLDDLIWFDDQKSKFYKYSGLAKIKNFSHSTKLPEILDSIKTFKLLKVFYN